MLSDSHKAAQISSPSEFFPFSNNESDTNKILITIKFSILETKLGTEVK